MEECNGGVRVWRSVMEECNEGVRVWRSVMKGESVEEWDGGVRVG